MDVFKEKANEAAIQLAKTISGWVYFDNTYVEVTVDRTAFERYCLYTGLNSPRGGEYSHSEQESELIVPE